jgi:hypothetical protein
VIILPSSLLPEGGRIKTALLIKGEIERDFSRNPRILIWIPIHLLRKVPAVKYGMTVENKGLCP